MSEEEYKKVIDIIVKYMHIEYGNNYAPKKVLDTNGLVNVQKELRKLVKEK